MMIARIDPGRATARVVLGFALVGAGSLGLMGTASAVTTADVVVGSCAGAPTAGTTTTTIQAAVDAAPSGGTVYVCPGTYDEAVDVTKQLTILGPQNGVDASDPASRIDPADEAVVDGGGSSPFTYSSGVGGTIDGFTLTGANTGTAAGIVALGGAGASSYSWDDNIIEDDVEGINFTTGTSAGASTIEQNRFVDNDQNPGNGTSGTGVFFTNGPSVDVSISHNSFSGDYGDGNGIINTTGSDSCSPPSTTGMTTGLVISNNTATIAAGQSNNFLVLFCTDHADVTGNTVTADASVDDSAVYIGGGDQNLTLSDNTLTGGAAGSGISMNSDFYDAGAGNVISGNTISGHSNGIVVRGDSVSGTHTSYDGFTLSDNTISGSVSDGISIAAGTADGVVTGNSVTGSGTFDCQDASSGSGTVGTANTWTDDTGATSSPAGLCSSPTAALPESPTVIGLPVAAVGAGGLAMVIIRRRRRRSA
jgi:hypothetical protein